jgi:DNA modification methylase
MTPQETSELEHGRDGVIRCSAWLGRIVCGDNTEVLSGFPDACIDLVVTSPPYDDLRTYGGHSWNFETLAAQLVRVLKPGGVIVWVVADATVNGSETLTSMRQAIHFKDVCGLNVHDTMTYVKKAPVPLTHNRYEQAWEYMVVLSKGRPSRWNPLTEPCLSAGMPNRMTHRRLSDELTDANGKGRAIKAEKYRDNCWEYQKENEGSEHPASFPLKLAKEHVLSWSNPGDVVLDPFAGSGTTLKAAKELNRQWCGIEINPEYCAIAEARLSQDVLQLETCAMRPNS